MIELRQWRQFIAVAEELHFGRAAERLHMTQPPLTQAIQSLERTLQVPLLTRSSRRVALTPAGEALLPVARRLIAMADDLPRVAQSAAAGQAGQLRLAFVSSIAYGPLPDWLRSFRESLPGVSLQLREATLDVQMAAFEAGEIDAGFVIHAPGAAPAGYAQWRALSEPLALALPESHPLAAKPRLRWADVEGQPLVIFPRAIAPSLYDALLAAYRERGSTPPIAQEAIQMQTIVNLVSGGMGWAWVPWSVTRLQRPGVVYREVVGVSLICECSLLWREPVAPVVQRFVQHLQDHPVPEQPAAERRQSALAGTRRP